MGCQHEYSTFNDIIYRFDCDGNPCGTNATRWGGRHPGNGRYSQYGIIRYYSDKVVHISIHTPVSMNITTTVEDAIEIIKNIMK